MTTERRAQTHTASCGVVTQQVVVQVEHSELGTVSNSDGETSPAFRADSWVSAQSQLPQTCTQENTTQTDPQSSSLTSQHLIQVLWRILVLFSEVAALKIRCWSWQKLCREASGLTLSQTNSFCLCHFHSWRYCCWMTCFQVCYLSLKYCESLETNVLWAWLNNCPHPAKSVSSDLQPQSERLWRCCSHRFSADQTWCLLNLFIEHVSDCTEDKFLILDVSWGLN